MCNESRNLLYTLKVWSEEVVLHSLNDTQALFSLPAITQCFILEDKSTWRYPRIRRHTQPQISNSPLTPAVVREYLVAARGKNRRARNECVSRGLGGWGWVRLELILLRLALVTKALSIKVPLLICGSAVLAVSWSHWRKWPRPLVHECTAICLLMALTFFYSLDLACWIQSLMKVFLVW